jgi:hypothetical protein
MGRPPANRCAPFPGEQFVEFGVRVIGYADNDVGKPGFRIDVVQASGLDELTCH